MNFCRKRCKWCGRYLDCYPTIHCYKLQRLRGPRGFSGCPGKTGERGPRGIQGITGPQGLRGDDGLVLTLLDTYNSYSDLKANHPTGQVGDMYLVDGDTYVWSENEQDWINAGQIKGARGDIGPTGATGPKGDDGVVVTILGTYESYEQLLDDHPTGYIGDMYLVNGDTFVWSENEQDWINAGQIKGARGDVGPTGITGIKGEPGPVGAPGEPGSFDSTTPLLYTTNPSGEAEPLYLGDTLPLSTFTTVHHQYNGSNGEGDNLIEWAIETTSIDLNQQTSLISISGTITMADFTGRTLTIQAINSTDEPHFKRLMSRIDKHAENVGSGEMNMLLYYYDQNGMTLTDQLTLAGGTDLVFNFQDTLILSET